MKISPSDLDLLWFTINSPRKAGPKWCQYSRVSIQKVLETLKRVMTDNGYEFKKID
jgi:hypothetical protein